MLQIGDWVRWYSPTRKRDIIGQIYDFRPNKAFIITKTWDGRGHHYYVPFKRLRKVTLV
jgi:hypothetical protein